MPSFDVVSKVTWHEIDNAIGQTQKEIGQRFDFKGTSATCEKQGETIVLSANAEDRVNAVLDVLKEKLIRRKVSLKHIDPQDMKPTGGGGFRIVVPVREGIDTDHAKDLVKRIKGSKLKVQASIQEKSLRVTGKKRDDLQDCIKFLKAEEFDLELQYVNFRD